MKKFLLSTLALAAAIIGANAQNAFTVSYALNTDDDYTVIENGATVTIDQLEEIDEEYWYELTAYLKVANNANGSLAINVKTEEVASLSTLHVLDGAGFCIGGNCFSVPCDLDRDMATGEVWDGVGSHFSYSIGGVNQMDPIDPNAPEYQGAWAGKLTLTAAGEVFTATFLFVNGSAGIDGIEADNAAPVYYNLQGIRVDNPQTGIFIRVQGNEVSKIIK